MLLLDRREPESIEKHVRALGLHVNRQLEMEFGDCSFSGNGPAGECMVGFERKKLDDLITSMKDRRLSGHQLRGCWNAFDFVYLVCEGLWREGSQGEIEEWGWDYRQKKQAWVAYYGQPVGGDRRRSVMYEQLDHYLSTLELKGGVIVKRTKDEQETARYYVSRWKWFNEKTWDQHTSHDQLYTNTPAKGHGYDWGSPHEHEEAYQRNGRGRSVGFQQDPPTTVWRMAAQLPGLDRRAAVVAQHFTTPEEMALAGLPPELRELIRQWRTANPKAALKAWQEIDFGVDVVSGRRRPGIGDVTAAAVWRAMTEKGA